MEQNYYITFLVDFVLPVIWSPEFLKGRNNRLKPLSFGSFVSKGNKVLFDWNYWYPISSVSPCIAKNTESFWIEKKKSQCLI